MMQWSWPSAVCAFCLLGCTVSTSWGQQDRRLAPSEAKADPREKLDTLIPEAIRVLEAKDYATFLKTFLSPAEFKAISEKTGLEEAEFAKQFGDKRAPQLLVILKSITDARPTLDESGTIATYELKEDVSAKKAFSFQKINKCWYMLNKPK